MNHKEAKPILMKYLGRPELTCYDFPHGPLVVMFEDDSFCCWYDAFAITESVMTYVFTEHNGYFEFYTESIEKIRGPTSPKDPAPPELPTT